ncbi:hypothetical protein ACHAWF_009676 [Thalassiosira exigua]
MTDPPPKPPRVRRTAGVTQMTRIAAKKDALHKKKAHKRATKMFAAEKEKGANGMSAEKVAEKVKKSYGWAPSSRTIYRYVNEGLAGASPLKSGEQGDVPQFVFNTLAKAFESFMRIQQLNARGGVENSRRKMMMRVNAVVGKEDSVSFSLFNRLLKETAVDFFSGKSKNGEERRILWTTYHNLKMWFENWEQDLLQLGFAKVAKDHPDWDDGTVYIPKEQLKNIVNFDESCLSMDGSDGVRGGQPESFFYDPNLPMPATKGTSKCSKTTTLITGSNAAGEALPPHFQFQTDAKTDEGQRFRNEMIEWMLNTRGTFGCDEEKSWPCTFGMNAKGGMDDVEFYKYVVNSILPLYPNTKDLPGRRTMLKVDSGPGRTCKKLIASLRMLGFILYPGVPNTTAVSQETDRNYGPFKTQFRKNLDLIVQARIAAGISVSLAPWLVGLVVFGGTDPKTKLNIPIEDGAFERGFSVAACLRAWEKVGAAPLTMKCLFDKQVRRQVGDAKDTINQLMRMLDEANRLAVQLLNRLGYAGDLLKATCEEVSKTKPISEPNTTERVVLLGKAKSHSAKFTTTGGGHLTSDDFIKSMEVETREAEIKLMEKDKGIRQQMEKVEREAWAVIMQPVPIQSYKDSDLAVLLTWHQVPRKDWGNKTNKVKLWKEILEKVTQPPSFEKWTEADDAKLEDLKKMEIDMKDTALGRQLSFEKRKMEAALESMDQDERAKLRRKLDELDQGSID